MKVKKERLRRLNDLLLRFNRRAGLYIAVFLIFIFILGLFSESRADSVINKQSIIITYNKPTKIGISAYHRNHLHFKNIRIVKVIGDKAKFDVRMLSNGSSISSDLFFISKLPVGKIIDIALMTSEQRVINLALGVENKTEPVIANFVVQEDGLEGSLDQSRRKDAKNMIDAMRDKRDGNYYVQRRSFNNKKAFDSSLKTLSKVGGDNLETKRVTQYRYGDLVGHEFLIKNKSRKLFATVKAKDLSERFNSFIAISVGKRVLSPREETRVFVVCLREKEEK